MILVAKILAVLLTIIVLSKTFLDYKKKQETGVMLIFWVISWLGILLLSVKPNYLFLINDRIGKDGAGVGTLLGIAFMFLFFVTYRVYVKAHRLERQLRDLVMKLGLKEIYE